MRTLARRIEDFVEVDLDAIRIGQSDGSYDTTLMWFRNGVFIGARSDKVYRYGIFDVTRIGN
jgi:hypothetical protein